LEVIARVSEPRFDALYENAGARDKSPWWGIHVARYIFAAPHVADCRVLDIACGSGYGLPLLQARARSVVGVDIDLTAARKARQSLKQGAGSVMVADGRSLPFADASFEVITSFETLEHLEHRGQFLSELKRVLIPGGLCILSTPNANYTLPVNGKPHNPFHVFEYTPAELTAELKNHFTSIELLGQVLDSRFRISPFWEDQQKMPRTLGTVSRLFLWRALNKMPLSVRNRLSQSFWGHPLYPGETDYRFNSATVEHAPVLMAICRKTTSN
jgi:2-polyprenyl-3-methyl-5-hydroxy-6-metoxy-1,4-benzoquinol methylase